MFVALKCFKKKKKNLNVSHTSFYVLLGVFWVIADFGDYINVYVMFTSSICEVTVTH
jgi:hypothetical protein